MRWLFALLIVATVLLHPALVGAAPAPQAVNLGQDDLPASAVMYIVPPFQLGKSATRA
jgi:hypothetical protein